ncbi:MAG TPA: hypothetical protein VE031_13500 [Chthoniobacterales bacterium]|nr:hypothetical protein [Chthoniobacterales bacterium]
MRHTLLVIAFICVAFTARSDSASPADPQLEGIYGCPPLNLSDARTDRLLAARKRAQRRGVCNVHHIRMQMKRVPIHFGLVDFQDPYFDYSISYFPNAEDYVRGGDEVDPAAEKKLYKKFICRKCKEVEHEWAVAHPKNETAQYILKSPQ